MTPEMRDAAAFLASVGAAARNAGRFLARAERPIGEYRRTWTQIAAEWRAIARERAALFRPAPRHPIGLSAIPTVSPAHRVHGCGEPNAIGVSWTLCGIPFSDDHPDTAPDVTDEPARITCAFCRSFAGLL